MTEDFKKGLATGLAVGGVTVVKGGEGGRVYVGTIDGVHKTFKATIIRQQVLVGQVLVEK